jgi:putative transposase
MLWNKKYVVMANTYTQLNIHVVIAVYGRDNALGDRNRAKIFEYISGIMKGLGLFPLAVNGYRDHVHLFFSMPPSKTLSKVVQEIKANSSKWINQERLVMGHFCWQEGYGAFSCSQSHRDNLIKYISAQEKHHAAASFRVEYQKLLNRYDIGYNPAYLFEFFE